MKYLLAVAVFVMFVSTAAAQTCTPIKLSKSYTNKDDGTGPYIEFVLSGTGYNQRSTINFTGTYFTNYNVYHGYVDVFALYGGCTQYWYINGFNYYYGLYDLDTNQWYDTPQQKGGVEDIACGRVPACAFSNTGNSYVLGVTPGHHYHLWAFVSMGTSVGTSDWFSDYVTINVQ